MLSHIGLLKPAEAAALAVLGLCSVALLIADDSPVAAQSSACANTDMGIASPAGFCAAVLADNIALQTLADALASGRYLVFAEGLPRQHEESGQTLHRPSGLSAGHDGVLYVSGDQRGRIIWRVTFQGSVDANITDGQTDAVAAYTWALSHPNENWLG